MTNYINKTRTILSGFEFIWLLRILDKCDTWEHKRIASRFVYNTLTKQREASGTQLYLLKHKMIQPYKKLLVNELSR